MKQASMTKYILHYCIHSNGMYILCWHHLTARNVCIYTYVLHISCGATIEIDTTLFHHEHNSWNMEKIKDDRNRKIATHMKQLTDYLRKTPRWQVNPFFFGVSVSFSFFSLRKGVDSLPLLWQRSWNNSTESWYLSCRGRSLIRVGS